MFISLLIKNKSNILILLLLSCLLISSCLESEAVDIVPDTIREKIDLLEACDEIIIYSQQIDSSYLKSLADEWRKQYSSLLGFSDSEFKRLITTKAISAGGDNLKVFYYYYCDWIYLPFEFQVDIEDLEEFEIAEAIRKKLTEGNFLPLPHCPDNRFEFTIETAGQLIDKKCSTDDFEVRESACPEITYQSGAVIYSPLSNNSGSKLLKMGEIELISEEICCNSDAASSCFIVPANENSLSSY